MCGCVRRIDLESRRTRRRHEASARACPLHCAQGREREIEKEQQNAPISSSVTPTKSPFFLSESLSLSSSPALRFLSPPSTPSSPSALRFLLAASSASRSRLSCTSDFASSAAAVADPGLSARARSVAPEASAAAASMPAWPAAGGGGGRRGGGQGMLWLGRQERRREERKGERERERERRTAVRALERRVAARVAPLARREVVPRAPHRVVVAGEDCTASAEGVSMPRRRRTTRPRWGRDRD